MTEVLFYHLERTTLEHILPDLLEKSLQRGWRALVRTRERDRAQAVDEFLWTYTDESFLPHGTGATAGDGAAHPVLITDSAEPAEGRDILFLIDGADAGNEELAGLTRCIRIFDGGDEAAVAAARAFWKQVRQAGHQATYWRQSPEGRWQKQG